MNEYGKIIAAIFISLLAAPALLSAEDKPAAAPVVKAAAKPVREAEFEEFWDEEPAEPQMRTSDEQVGRIIEQIRKTDPKRADELMRLKKQNPEQFRVEIQTEMLRQFRQERQRNVQGGEPTAPGPMPAQPGPGPGGMMAPPGGHWKERLEKKHNELIGWLEKNYPDKAKELQELQKRDPEQYIVQIGEAMRRYEPIIGTQKNNPKLAEILTEDLKLQTHRDNILKELRTAKDPQRQELVKELKEATSRRFDLIMAKKQIQYDQLLVRLEKLKVEVGKRENELEKLKANKDKAVEEHLKELIEQTEKIEW